MDILRKLPFILGSIMTIIVGYISSVMKLSNKETYIRMIIVLVVFYIIGIYLRNVLLKIIEEIKLEKDQKELEIKRLEEENEAARKLDEKNKGQNLDITTDEDEFLDEDISKILSGTLEE